MEENKIKLGRKSEHDHLDISLNELIGACEIEANRQHDELCKTCPKVAALQQEVGRLKAHLKEALKMMTEVDDIVRFPDGYHHVRNEINAALASKEGEETK